MGMADSIGAASTCPLRILGDKELGSEFFRKALEKLPPQQQKQQQDAQTHSSHQLHDQYARPRKVFSQMQMLRHSDISYGRSAIICLAQ